MFFDYKSELNIYCQQSGKLFPVYNTTGYDDFWTSSTITLKGFQPDDIYFRSTSIHGFFGSKKEAEQTAANLALKYLIPGYEPQPKINQPPQSLKAAPISYKNEVQEYVDKRKNWKKPKYNTYVGPGSAFYSELTLVKTGSYKTAHQNSFYRFVTPSGSTTKKAAEQAASKMFMDKYEEIEKGESVKIEVNVKRTVELLNDLLKRET